MVIRTCRTTAVFILNNAEFYKCVIEKRANHPRNGPLRTLPRTMIYMKKLLAHILQSVAAVELGIEYFPAIRILILN